MKKPYILSTKDESFSHRELSKPIRCDDDELRAHIKSWTSNENWRYDDFAIIAELLGYTLPITLKDMEEYKEYGHPKKRFTVSSKKKISTWVLHYGDAVDFYSAVEIIDKNTISYYSITGTSERKSFKAVLNCQLRSHGGKKIKCSYDTICCKQVLSLANGYELTVKVREPGEADFEATTSKVLESVDQVEKYIFSISNDCENLDLEKVYENVIRAYQFDENDVKNCKEAYIKFSDSTEKVLGELIMERGKCVKFSQVVSDRTYWINYDGSWVYTSDKIILEYNAAKKEYRTVISGDTISSISKGHSAEIIAACRKCEKFIERRM